MKRNAENGRQDGRHAGRQGARHGGALAVVFLMIAALACAAVVAVVVVLKTVKVHRTDLHAAGSSGLDKDEQVTVDIPGGSFQVKGHKRLDPESVGVPVYPGASLARKDSTGGASFAWTSADGKSDKSLTVAGADYVTQDSADQVLQFYRGKLNNWIFLNKKDGKFDFERTDGAWKRIVAIHEQSDGTHIGVASIGEPAGN